MNKRDTHDLPPALPGDPTSPPAKLETNEVMDFIRTARRAASPRTHDLNAALEKSLMIAREARDHYPGTALNLTAEFDEWHLDEEILLTSHRPGVGKLIGFAKRWVLYPIFRWPFLIMMQRFYRQKQMNGLMLSWCEDLWERHLELEKQVAELQRQIAEGKE